MPIFVAFVILNVIGVFVFFGVAGGLFANSIYSTATLGALSAVPLFIVMGEIMFRSGAMDVLFDSLDRLIGRIRGRQYVLCIVLSAILGALSGAAMAVAGLLGRSLFPTMRKRGYDTQFSAGTILAGASLDPIIPPSVLAVIIATLADVRRQDADRRHPAGPPAHRHVPVYVLIRVRITPSLAPDVAADAADRKTQGSVLMALARMIPSAYVFFMVMGLIMLGVATPTEAAATGVVVRSCSPPTIAGCRGRC